MVAALLIPFLMLAGCGKPVAKVAPDTKAFELANPEIKAAWEKIVSAAAANDYPKVILGCRQLQGTGDLTPEQRVAVNALQTAVSERMFDAAQKGDANASNAIAEIRKNWR